MKEAEIDKSTTDDSTGPLKRKRKWALSGLKLLVSASLIYWLVSRVSLEEVFAAMRMVDLRLIAVALLLNFVGYAISINRWRILLKAQGVTAPFLFLVQSYMTGVFFNNLLPSTIGGDAMRAYDSWRIGGSKGKALSVIFVDRFTGTLALLIFAAVAVFLFQTTHLQMPFLQWILVGCVAGGGVVLWLVFSRPLRTISRAYQEVTYRVPKTLLAWVTKFNNAFSVFQGKHSALFWALGLSLLLQANVVTHYFVIALAMDFSVDFYNYFYIIPLSLAVMAIPVSINAIGIRESAFAFFFGLHGVEVSDALAFAWVVYLVLIANGVLGGVIYGLRQK